MRHMNVALILSGGTGTGPDNFEPAGGSAAVIASDKRGDP